MINMKNTIFLLLFLLPIITKGQSSFNPENVSSKILRTSKRIAEINEVMGSHVGEGGVQSNQYDHYTFLYDKATNLELIELTNHPNGVVRCYAFQGLGERDSISLFPFVLAHLGRYNHRDDFLWLYKSSFAV